MQLDISLGIVIRSGGLVRSREEIGRAVGSVEEMYEFHVKLFCNKLQKIERPNLCKPFGLTIGVLSYAGF